MAHLTNRPLIGLTADYEEREAGQTEAEYVLRTNYASAIVAAGGLPVILPYDICMAGHYAQLLDGVIVTGGMFDIDPDYYGEAAYDGLVTKDNRTAFEFALLDAALKADKPILGICNGMQLLGVKLGGKLVQDIMRDVEGGIEHLPENPPIRATHDVKFSKGSFLGGIVGLEQVRINSLHHQAVSPALGYSVCATSVADGVIEAIEVPGKAFCIGLQWHPEYFTNSADIKILKAFVCTAQKKKGI